jgi:HrpA-like RNA helicase
MAAQKNTVDFRQFLNDLRAEGKPITKLNPDNHAWLIKQMGYTDMGIKVCSSKDPKKCMKSSVFNKDKFVPFIRRMVFMFTHHRRLLDECLAKGPDKFEEYMVAFTKKYGKQFSERSEYFPELMRNADELNTRDHADITAISESNYFYKEYSSDHIPFVEYEANVIKNPTSKLRLPTWKKQEVRQVDGSISHNIPVDHICIMVDQLWKQNLRKVLIIKAETGSGKTTQIPVALLEYGFSIDTKIICSQPRIITTQEASDYVSRQMGLINGIKVGYHSGGEKVYSEKDTELIFATEGTIIEELIALGNEEFFRKYKYIVLDEVHERSHYMDLLLVLLRDQITKVDNKCTVIVMSATLDLKFFADYFGVGSNLGQHTFFVKGTTANIRMIPYRKDPVGFQEIEDAVYETIVKINNEQRPLEDILVFLPNIRMIQAVKSRIMAMSNDERPLAVIEYHSRISMEEESKRLKAHKDLVPTSIVTNGNSPMRKVYLATDRAETGITIRGIKHVIDTGLKNMPIYDPLCGANGLIICEINKNNAMQRRGRVGRTEDGSYWYLFTQKSFDKLEESNYSQLFMSSFAKYLCILLNMAGSSVMNFDERFAFPDPLPLELKNDAYHELWESGSIDNEGKITQLGKFMVTLGIGARETAMLLLACNRGCSYDIAAIIALTQVQFSTKINSSIYSNLRTTYFNSDHLCLLELYEEFKHCNDIDSQLKWAKTTKMNYELMAQGDELCRDLLAKMTKSGLPINTEYNRNPEIRRRHYSNVLFCISSHMRTATLSENAQDFYVVDNAMNKDFNATIGESIIYYSFRKLSNDIKIQDRKKNIRDSDGRKNTRGAREEQEKYSANQIRIYNDYFLYGDPRQDKLMRGNLPKKIVFSGLTIREHIESGLVMYAIDWISPIIENYS